MAAPKPNERRFAHRILICAFGSSLLLFGPIVGQLAYLQCYRHDYYTQKAKSLHSKTVKITPQRGSIYSGQGRPLATSTFRESVYLAPYYLGDDARLRRRLAARLALALNLPVKTMEQRMQSKRDTVVERKLPPETVRELLSLREELEIPLPSLYFVSEGTRLYPRGALAAQVVGYTRPDDYGDNVGLAGVEAQYNKEIAGLLSEEKVQVNILRQDLSPLEDDALLRASGNDIYLTIDEAIQEYAEAALNEHVAKFEAKGGVCVVMEVGTGAVLALASNPTFDLNERGTVPAAARKNRCIVDSISPGSVMKVFTSTALLEYNKMSPDEMIDCHGGRIYYGSRVVTDHHKMGVVPVHEAFAESSNVAFTLLGQRLAKEELFAQFRKFGFGRLTGIDLPGEGSGIMYPLDKWTYQSRISLPIGYEIMVTPVQLAAAMCAIANKGIYVRPRVLKEIRSPKNEVVYRAEPKALPGRVCSPQTSEIVLAMMEEVVTSGTGKTAVVPGYRVGGKTGTTVKDKQAGDESTGKKYYASFLGVVPLGAPRVVIYVWVDEPSVKWGSAVAAPIVGQVARHVVRILGIEPTEEIVPSRDDLAEMAEAAESAAGPARKTIPALPAPADAGRVMPDFTGQTVRQVVRALQRLHMNARMTGWGVAVQQNPAPGELLANGTPGLIIFAPPGEARDKPTSASSTLAMNADSR